MKAYFQLAQAQIALGDPSSALTSAKKAHEFCVEECVSGGKGASSIGPITELVLRAKKEDWERREDERLKGMDGLLAEVVMGLERSRDGEVEGLKGLEVGEEERERRVEEVRGVWEGKIREVRRVWESAEGCNGLERRRKVPDWCVDDITFSVMLDPVVVCLPFPTSFPYYDFATKIYCSFPLNPANEDRPKQVSPTIAPRSWNTFAVRQPILSPANHYKFLICGQIWR